MFLLLGKANFPSFSKIFRRLCSIRTPLTQEAINELNAVHKELIGKQLSDLLEARRREFYEVEGHKARRPPNTKYIRFASGGPRFSLIFTDYNKPIRTIKISNNLI